MQEANCVALACLDDRKFLLLLLMYQVIIIIIIKVAIGTLLTLSSSVTLWRISSFPPTPGGKKGKKRKTKKPLKNKDPSSISFSGTHFTRGNPQTGCGGFSLRYVLAYSRLLHLPSRWRIPKVGVTVAVAVDKLRVLVCVYIATTLIIMAAVSSIYFVPPKVFFETSILCFFFIIFIIIIFFRCYLTLPDCLPSLYLYLHLTGLPFIFHGSDVHHPCQRLLRIANVFPKCSRPAILLIR